MRNLKPINLNNFVSVRGTNYSEYGSGIHYPWSSDWVIMTTSFPLGFQANITSSSFNLFGYTLSYMTYNFTVILYLKTIWLNSLKEIQWELEFNSESMHIVTIYQATLTSMTYQCFSEYFKWQNCSHIVYLHLYWYVVF